MQTLSRFLAIILIAIQVVLIGATIASAIAIPLGMWLNPNGPEWFLGFLGVLGFGLMAALSVGVN